MDTGELLFPSRRPGEVLVLGEAGSGDGLWRCATAVSLVREGGRRRKADRPAADSGAGGAGRIPIVLTGQEPCGSDWAGGGATGGGESGGGRSASDDGMRTPFGGGPCRRGGRGLEPAGGGGEGWLPDARGGRGATGRQRRVCDTAVFTRLRLAAAHSGRRQHLAGGKYAEPAGDILRARAGRL